MIQPTNPMQDRFLNCQQLKFALSEAEYHYRAATRKKDNAEAYAGNPTCFIKTQFNIIKAQEAARDRTDYLKTVMREKGCLGQKEVKINEKDDTIANTPLPATSELKDK